MAKKQPRERKYVTCEDCGNVMPADAIYCDECGAELYRPAPEPAPTSSKFQYKAYTPVRPVKKKPPVKSEPEEAAAAPDDANDPVNAGNKSEPKQKLSLKTNRRLQEVLICIAAVLILALIVDFRYRVTMPDLNGLEAVDARSHLVELGFDKEKIHVQTEDGTEVSDPGAGLYIVTSQSPDKNRKVRKSKDIVMVCEDRGGIIDEILKNAYYAHPAGVIAQLSEYYFTVDVLDSAGYDYSDHYDSYNDDQKDLLYIIDIGEVDHRKNTVAFYVDNEYNIEVAVEDALAGNEGKTVPSLISKAAKRHYGYKLTAQDGSDFTASYNAMSEADKEKQLVTSIGFDHEARQVVIGTQSEAMLAEQTLLAELATKLPYVGLDEKYIDNTLLGKRDKYDAKTGLYEWLSDDGKYQVFTAVCKDGKVDSVERKNTEIYWADENAPNTAADKDAIDAEKANEPQGRRPH